MNVWENEGDWYAAEPNEPPLCMNTEGAAKHYLELLARVAQLEEALQKLRLMLGNLTYYDTEKDALYTESMDALVRAALSTPPSDYFARIKREAAAEEMEQFGRWIRNEYTPKFPDDVRDELARACENRVRAIRKGEL